MNLISTLTLKLHFAICIPRSPSAHETILALLFGLINCHRTVTVKLR